ncbi:MAG: hypothetical protein PVI99_02295 [Anaerolineales bacterium]
MDIQTRTRDADDHRWREVPFWEYVPAAAGQTGLIVFDKQLAAGRDLRVWYLSDHPRVSAHDDVINELIHPALATAAVAVEALRWQNARLSGGDEALVFQLNEANAQLERMRVLYPVWRPRRRARMRFAGVG